METPKAADRLVEGNANAALSSYQLYVLRDWQHVHDNPTRVTVQSTLAKFATDWGGFTVVAVAMSFLLWSVDLPVAATFVFGVYVGSLYAYISRTRLGVTTWPIAEMVIDWDKVRSLLDSHVKQ